MALIKSISGIRGTIGGEAGENLTPVDVVKFTAAYASYIKGVGAGLGTGLCAGDSAGRRECRAKVVVGRDARISGDMVHGLVVNTLCGCGIDVVDAGLCTTPGVELAVVKFHAAGGIIITASHNPRQWNALKLLDARGEFLDARAGAEILKMAESFGAEAGSGSGGGAMEFAEVDSLGRVVETVDFTAAHVEAVMGLELVDCEAIRTRGFRVAFDAVNSVGGVAIPALLEALGCEVVRLNCEPTGEFAHNPEPLPENLTEIAAAVVREGADLGVVVDPDVDRLALVCENGEMFGEEYTLVAVAAYVLSANAAGAAGRGGNTVSNLSSSRALRDVTERLGGKYFTAAVGEVNVVAKMKEVGAVIGGEGNGGVIYPESHYGRDALVGVALVLSHLARTGLTTSELRAACPNYHISKNKIELAAGVDVDAVLRAVKQAFEGGGTSGAPGKGGVERVTDIDGVKIDFADHRWVHLRRSNTEPIIRIYSEAPAREEAEKLAAEVIELIKKII